MHSWRCWEGLEYVSDTTLLDAVRDYSVLHGYLKIFGIKSGENENLLVHCGQMSHHMCAHAGEFVACSHLEPLHKNKCV